jgi:hypothetical protein
MRNLIGTISSWKLFFSDAILYFCCDPNANLSCSWRDTLKTLATCSALKKN